VRSFEEAFEAAADERAFANGTEGYGWMDAWCARCLREAPLRSGLKGARGCPLILVAMMDRRPMEWLPQRDENGLYSIADQYHCIEFRDNNGGGGGYEPRPKPEPPNMDGLFERPERAARMLKQPEAPSHLPQLVG
jgi:hypothetical protein